MKFLKLTSKQEKEYIQWAVDHKNDPNNLILFPVYHPIVQKKLIDIKAIPVEYINKIMCALIRRKLIEYEKSLIKNSHALLSSSGLITNGH